jgi:hypothetical protein
MLQCAAEVRSINPYIRLPRDTDRVTNHHLSIEAPDERLGLVGKTSGLAVVYSLAKSQSRRKLQEKDAAQRIHIITSQPR